MKENLPSFAKFEKTIFGRRDSFSTLLAFSIDLMGAKQAALLYGTNQTKEIFVSPDQWDRGVIHRFKGSGKTGLYLNLFGKAIIKLKKLSPVALYKHETPGKSINNDGIIAYILRNYIDFYKKGVKIVIVRQVSGGVKEGKFLKLPVLSYDGKEFSSLFDLKVDSTITTQFIVENFIGVYVPDYGALVIDTMDKELLLWEEGCFVNDSILKHRLDLLIKAIETASLACLRHIKGKKAVEVLWRKERALRDAAAELQKKEAYVEQQKRYLMAVGAVTQAMVDMEPVTIDDGVYAFVDMVGSVSLRNFYSPNDYFFITNQLREIAANLASSFYCRLGNFIGDAFFLQNVSVFDPEEMDYTPTIHERTVLMTMLLVSIFRELNLLVQGLHPMDPEQRVKTLLKKENRTLAFRSGIETGPATIGPVGSIKRRIVTAIGEAVDRASRLESSGLPNEIHMSSTVMRLLTEASISRSTKLVYPIMTGLYPGMKGMCEKERSLLETCGSVRFMDLYTKGFKPFQNVITKRNNVQYKEFSSKNTYLLKWNRGSLCQNICLGI